MERFTVCWSGWSTSDHSLSNKIFKWEIMLHNFDQSLSWIFKFYQDGFKSLLGAKKNWGKWSEMLALKFPDINFGEIILKNLWLVTIKSSCL